MLPAPRLLANRNYPHVLAAVVFVSILGISAVAQAAPNPPAITKPSTSRLLSAAPHLEGTTDANLTVRIYEGSTLIARTTANGSGAWSLNVTTLSSGDHTLVARAFDGTESLNSSDVKVRVDPAETYESILKTVANGIATLSRLFPPFRQPRHRRLRPRDRLLDTAARQRVVSPTTDATHTVRIRPASGVGGPCCKPWTLVHHL